MAFSWQYLYIETVDLVNHLNFWDLLGKQNLLNFMLDLPLFVFKFIEENVLYIITFFVLDSFYAAHFFGNYWKRNDTLAVMTRVDKRLETKFFPKRHTRKQNRI